MRLTCRLAAVSLSLAGLLVAGAAAAAVVDSTSTGFLVRSEAVMKAAPDSVYRALTAGVASWWDPEHTWSGDARNLSLDATPGGCFCERLPGGGVRHLIVVYAAPGRLLRLTGGLGPLQGAGVAGSLTFALSAAGAGTKVQMSYSVGGYFQGGLASLAPMVDAVLAGQLARLERYVETGRPAAE